MDIRPLLQVRDLHKHFPVRRTGLWGRPDFVRAVDGVSFDVQRGEVLALVGESGCGKSSLALTLLGLERPSAGQIVFDGQDVTRPDAAGLKQLRRRVQMVFQDPFESLNPMMTIGALVEEPLLVHGLAPEREARRARVCRALEDAGLKPAQDFLGRLPHELSGGQRQRVVIAGALVLEPSLLLADEPVSMLDVSIRAEILNLLAELRRTRGISVLFITHDLSTAAYFVDRVAVMYLGRIVELGPTETVLRAPHHPYTQALISVVPVPNPRARRAHTILQGETPNPLDLPSGCRFHPRCPAAFERCPREEPGLLPTAPDHGTACWLAPEHGNPGQGASNKTHQSIDLESC